MDVVTSNTLIPGDPRMIDHIVYELKSQGIFDQFRKECIADVDTKPAYQNLRQRVEGSVSGFLKTQIWKPDMNKNQLREMLRKNIYESGFLETGVERIVDQVVNPKINTVFLSQVEDVVYKFLGIDKPSRCAEFGALNGPLTLNTIDLLPTGLDPISPDSEFLDKAVVKSELDDSKNDDYESPPFEPITEKSFLVHDDTSNDSKISGISGLTSHDSNNSENNLQIIAPDVSNPDSHLSKVSSNSRLSIITTDNNNSEKMDISEESKGEGSNSELLNFSNCITKDEETVKIVEESSKQDDKKKDKKYDKKDKYKSSKSSSKDRDKSRDKNKSQNDKDKSYRSSKPKKSSSEDSKSRKSISSKPKDKKPLNKSKKDDKKSSKRDKDDHSSSRDKKTESRRSTDRDSNDGSPGVNPSLSNSQKSSKSKQDSKSDQSETSTSNSADSNHSNTVHKHLAMAHSDNETSESSMKHKKVPQSDNDVSESSLKHKKVPQSDNETSESSMKHKKVPQSDNDVSESSLKHKKVPQNDNEGQKNVPQTDNELSSSSMKHKRVPQSDSDVPESSIRLKKPKIASNIFEVRRLMKIRKQMEKIEKKRLKMVEKESEGMENVELKMDLMHCDIENSKTNNVQATSVVSKESWDAIEAKLSQSAYENVDFNSYEDENMEESSTKKPKRNSEDEDCLYFNNQVSPTTERFLKSVESFRQSTAKLASHAPSAANRRAKSPQPAKKARKPVVGGRKRRAEKEGEAVYAENNNRKIGESFSDHPIDLDGSIDPTPSNSNIINGSTKVKQPTKSKKSRKNTIAVNNSDTFSLPLTPESDVSGNQIDVKHITEKDSAVPVKNTRALSLKNQRYSSDDLYKPRPFVSGSRRQRGLLNNSDKK